MLLMLSLVLPKETTPELALQVPLDMVLGMSFGMQAVVVLPEIVPDQVPASRPEATCRNQAAMLDFGPMESCRCQIHQTRR